MSDKTICKCGHIFLAHLTTGPCDFIGLLMPSHEWGKCPCMAYQPAEPASPSAPEGPCSCAFPTYRWDHDMCSVCSGQIGECVPNPAAPAALEHEFEMTPEDSEYARVMKLYCG